MFGLLASKKSISALAAVAVVAVVWFGYRHYTGMINEMKELHAAQAAAELALDVERQSVRSLREAIATRDSVWVDMEHTLQRMQEEANEARTEARRLRQLFAEVDLESMSAAGADSLAGATSDRLWRLIQEATSARRSSDSAGGAEDGEAAQP